VIDLHFLRASEDDDHVPTITIAAAIGPDKVVKTGGPSVIQGELDSPALSSTSPIPKALDDNASFRSLGSLKKSMPIMGTFGSSGEKRDATPVPPAMASKGLIMPGEEGVLSFKWR